MVVIAFANNSKMERGNFSLNFVMTLMVFFSFKDGDEMFPKDENGKMIFAFHDKVEVWKVSKLNRIRLKIDGFGINMHLYHFD